MSTRKFFHDPQKVDEFRQAELEQYLDEALFLLELIGVRVFKSNSIAVRKKRSRANNKTESQSSTAIDLPNTVSTNSCSKIPPLPDDSLKVGQFVYVAMQNLSDSGYVFSDETLAKMTSVEWSVSTFHTNKPFMKMYIQGKTDNKGSDGSVRFKSKPYTFGKHQVLITKERFERQRKYFIAWYKSLT